ncbi:hypothetical protein PFISCL1PPCAC_18817, partial [Pristionchus fissidentatus]
SSSSPASTLFSSVVHIFVPATDSSVYTSFGRGGVALISRSDTKTLLLYTATKSILAQLPISASFPITLTHPYLYFTAVDGKRWSIVFDDDELLKKLLAWYLSITGLVSSVFDVSVGVTSSPQIEEGNALLIGISIYSIDGNDIKIREEPDVKLRLSSKRHKYEWERHLFELRKSATRMISSSSTVILITVKKVRQRETESENRDIEPAKDTVSNPVSDPLPDPTTVSDDSTSSDNNILQRTAKLGKPMLGLAEIIPATVSLSAVDPSLERTEDAESKDFDLMQAVVTEESTVVQSTADQPATVPQPSYADFHRVVGLEMDRLQIRLESSFSRMIQESLAPIKDQLLRLEARQDEILQLLSDKKSNNDE